VRLDSLAQIFIDSNGSANCKMGKNNKRVLMPEFLWDVNESHRTTVGYPTKFYNHLKLYSNFASLREKYY